MFSQPIVLENNLVLLRPLELTDGPHLAHFARNEPEIWQYSLVRIAHEEDLQKYIAQAVENRQAGKEYPFIVFDKKTDRYAGSTRFYDIQPAHQSLQLGYTWYGKAFQGTHVNRNCKWLLLQYAFETLGMERVEFRADNRNQRSIAAMHRIGCVTEGVLRNHLPNAEGGRRDSIVLSILRQEWFATVRDNLARLVSAS